MGFVSLHKTPLGEESPLEANFSSSLLKKTSKKKIIIYSAFIKPLLFHTKYDCNGRFKKDNSNIFLKQTCSKNNFN